MRTFKGIAILFFLISCSKPQYVLICGDHICVNKSEAEQYFEENLTIEVKIIKKKEKRKIDLVELNLSENPKGNKRISLLSKEKTDKDIKILSNKEISKIKKNLKKKKNEKKITKKKDLEEKKITKKIDLKEIKIKNAKKAKKNINNMNENREDVFDVCTILEKCNIDEISKYLIKHGKNKRFPDITTRQ